MSWIDQMEEAVQQLQEAVVTLLLLRDIFMMLWIVQTSIGYNVQTLTKFTMPLLVTLFAKCDPA